MGEGSFGKMVKCLKTATNEHVAMKVMKKHPHKTQNVLCEIFILRMIKALDKDNCAIAGWHGWFEDESPEEYCCDSDTWPFETGSKHHIKLNDIAQVDEDEAFQQFMKLLMGMLQLESLLRFTPQEIVEHPFCTIPCHDNTDHNSIRQDVSVRLAGNSREASVLSADLPPFISSWVSENFDGSGSSYEDDGMHTDGMHQSGIEVREWSRSGASWVSTEHRPRQELESCAEASRLLRSPAAHVLSEVPVKRSKTRTFFDNLRRTLCCCFPPLLRES
ncbi:hypothetical protein CRUP_029864 [Coryphaenoides rupestris]|nr:hypothetical protein CRUP_029864 [Coryphaenoides rupestris]